MHFMYSCISCTWLFGWYFGTKKCDLYSNKYGKCFFNLFFFKHIFFQIKPFPPKNVFLNKKVLQYILGLKCYIIFLKLFIWHLSRRIDRTNSAEKGAAIGKSQTVINWKRIDEEHHLCTQTYSEKHSSWLEKVQYEINFCKTFSALLPSIYLLLKSLLSKLLTLPYQLCRQKKIRVQFTP